MRVNIDDDYALDLLMNRVVDYFDYGTDEYKLYELMYERAIYENIFENFNVNEIVDNDIINWCDIIDETDERYEQAKTEENDDFFVEAEYNGKFLIKY